jgi:hypothetical protein
MYFQQTSIVMSVTKSKPAVHHYCYCALLSYLYFIVLSFTNVAWFYYVGFQLNHFSLVCLLLLRMHMSCDRYPFVGVINVETLEGFPHVCGAG